MSNGELGQLPVQPAMQPSAGELLKTARESAGLHIAALAVMLKVPVKKLEALETSRFDLLPDTVFVRALASSVCRTLKIDAAPIMERLPQVGMTQLAQQGHAINAPFRSPHDGPGRSMWSRLPKPAFSAVLLLLLASMAIAYWPVLTNQFQRLNTFADRKAVSSLSEPVQKNTASEPVDLKSEKALVGVTVSPGVVITGVQPENNAAGVLASSANQPFDPAAVSVSGNQSATTSPVAAATAAPPSGIVIFRAVGDSWVEVTDSNRQSVLRRTLKQGEVIGVSGALPLSATVGRADMTQVDVRGRAFDLTPWSRNNVARFEVK